MTAIGIGISPVFRVRSSSAYITLCDGLICYRWGLRSGFYVIDFSYDGGVTWELDLVSLDPTEELAVILAGSDPAYRKQIRNDTFMLDKTITATGFAGIEDTDWENIYSTIPDGYWSTYWTTRTDLLLFFGQIKNISGGQLNNEMKGSSDHLDVTGSAGSYTFQCPNNATYISADTDYIWFNDDGVQRVPTESELIGYDLQKTPVKYDDASPNSIRWIAILKNGITLTATEKDNLFRSFLLSPWWDDSFNDYGHIKGNRNGEQILWTPELTGTVIDTFTDTDAVTISSHTPDKGVWGWTNATYVIDILGNKARYNGSGAYAQAYMATTIITNPDLWVTLTIPNENNYVAGFVVRRNGNSTQWRVMILRSAGGTPAIKIYKYTTEVKTVDVTHVTGDGVLRCVVSGNNFDVYWKGVKVIDTYVSDGSWNTVANHGIITYKDANFKEVLFNDFIIK